MVSSIQLTVGKLIGPCKCKCVPRGLWVRKTHMGTYTHTYICPMPTYPTYYHSQKSRTPSNTALCEQTCESLFWNICLMLNTKKLKDWTGDYMSVYNEHEMIKTRNHKALPSGSEAHLPHPRPPHLAGHRQDLPGFGFSSHTASLPQSVG